MTDQAGPATAALDARVSSDRQDVDLSVALRMPEIDAALQLVVGQSEEQQRIGTANGLDRQIAQLLEQRRLPAHSLPRRLGADALIRSCGRLLPDDIAWSWLNRVARRGSCRHARLRGKLAGPRCKT